MWQKRTSVMPAGVSALVLRTCKTASLLATHSAFDKSLDREHLSGAVGNNLWTIIPHSHLSQWGKFVLDVYMKCWDISFESK